MSDKYGNLGYDHRREQLRRIQKREEDDLLPAATAEELAAKFTAWFRPLRPDEQEEEETCQ